MTADDAMMQRPVPRRAITFSLAALAVPAAGTLWAPAVLGENEVLLWLSALIPAFLLSYYRGWTGAALALAAGMAALALTQVAVAASGRPLQGGSLLFGVVTAYIGISLGIGWVADALHRDRRRVEALALTDPLTGLPNRRQVTGFLERRRPAAGRRRGGSMVVVLFDLDHFKSYNDTHGHPAGDEALRTFGEILSENTRRTDCSARVGGEEFITVLTEAGLSGALVFVDRLRAQLRSQRRSVAPFSASVGMSVDDDGALSVEELIAAADRALYRAKESGRDCVRVERRMPLPLSA